MKEKKMQVEKIEVKVVIKRAWRALLIYGGGQMQQEKKYKRARNIKHKWARNTTGMGRTIGPKVLNYQTGNLVVGNIKQVLCAEQFSI